MSVFELAPEPDTERLPPQDIAAEASLLGAMMLSKDAISEAVEIVRADDFYRPAHQLIFDVILDFYVHDEPADAVTVASGLTKRGELGKVGGATYLHTLVSGVATAANADFYARIIRERAILRRLVEAGTRITALGYNGQGEVDDIVDRAQSEIFEVTERRTGEDFKPLKDLVHTVFEEFETLAQRKEGLIGVPSGLTELDKLTNGFQPGQLIIVAARPGLGKSTLAMDFCRATSLHTNLPSAFFSLEMSASEITMRLLSAESGLELSALRGLPMRARPDGFRGAPLHRRLA